MSVFGNLTGADRVEAEVKATLEKWMLTYLAEIERQRAIPARSLPNIRHYVHVNEFTKDSEDQLPLCVIISPGIAEQAAMQGDGSFNAKYVIGVGIVVSGSSQELSNNMAKWYGAAVRGALLQHQGLEGISVGIEWQDERFDDVPSSDSRNLASVQEVFLVEVPGITNERLGLMEPPEDPYDVPNGWPEAETVQVAITKEDE